MGVNGGGKSTIVKLLCRFYDPTHGQITWDGMDIRDLRVEDLRSRIGAVFQDFMAYDFTVSENVAVGDLPSLADPGPYQVRRPAGRRARRDRGATPWLRHHAESRVHQ